MIRLLIAASLAIAATAAPAAADCTHEVVQAFARLGNETSVRKVSNIINEDGPIVMTIEYIKPGRMRQVVKPVADPSKVVETILINDQAWGNVGNGWEKLAKSETEQFRDFYKKTTEEASSMVGLFECLGGEVLDGQKVRAYRGLPPKKEETPGKPKTEDEKATEAALAANEAVRVVYLDPDKGLPVRAVFALRDKLDQPIFRESFSYPSDLSIEAPSPAGK